MTSSRSRSDRDAILARYRFELDDFQHQAFDAFDDGDNVIVAAPTGSGKTVVAEYGLDAARRDSQRAFYTAPIKALSNQKYRDLIDFYGESKVGLLTGDNAINGDAPIVVMTTEVLRNMVYAQRDLTDLGVVVADEVHFLQDNYRGPVWEELIIHLPAHVQLVCLSATVSNTDELAEWIETVRGPTTAVVESKRPVELENLTVVQDLSNNSLRVYSTLKRGKPNPKMLQLDIDAQRLRRQRQGHHRQRDRTKPKPTKSKPGRQLATPNRLDVVERLARDGLLPAIFFIFSRKQCAEMANAAWRRGYRFTTAADRDQIRDLAADRLAGLETEDLKILGYQDLLEQLLVGVAPHHAGMIPPFKELVERCFVEGLIKVVFATETLAVGINMPARSVVIDKLTKFTGERHESLTPAQFTQLTGRAGRRGIDEHGSAVVLWNPYVRFEQVARLTVSRSFHLRSAFRPTYNMVANLVRTYDQTTARQLLGVSFAQFQADREVVKFERQLQRKRRQLDDLLAEAKSPFGDIEAYRARHLSDGRHRSREPIESALAELVPGQVIQIDAGRYKVPAAVVATAMRRGGPKISLITPDGSVVSVTADDFEAVPYPLGDVVLPGSFSPNNRTYRHEVGNRIKQADLRSAGRSRRSKADRAAPEPAPEQPDPVTADPNLGHRLAALATADSVRAEIGVLERKVETRDRTLVREFDHVLNVLEQRGYVNVQDWKLESGGRMLARTFHEQDLLICDALQNGILDGLSPPELAGLVSTFGYEHRSADEPPPPWFPRDHVRRAFDAITALSRQLARLEAKQQLSVHRHPDPTFFPVAYAWVAGEGFAELVDDDELTGGDFVRQIKQLIDLLGQISKIAPQEPTRRVARQAAEAAYRGVVADASDFGPVSVGSQPGSVSAGTADDHTGGTIGSNVSADRFDAE